MRLQSGRHPATRAARRILLALALAISAAGSAAAQQQPGAPEEHPELAPAGMRNEGFGTLVEPETVGSANVRLITHVPLGSPFTVADIEIEQELSRPYAYVSRMNGSDGSAGLTILSLKEPAAARVLHTWGYEGASGLRGMGGTDCKYFKLDGRYYVALAVRWSGGAHADVGAVVLDVTGLPDPRSVREVARIRYAAAPGGFENLFAYRHSNGRVLLFASTNTSHANVYDMRKVLGDAPDALVATVPLPNTTAADARFHDMHVAFHVDTQQDRFYGAGTGGYYVYDVSRPVAPKLVTTVTALGVPAGGAFAPTPDGKFAIGQTEYQYAPLRMFDLRAGVPEVKRPVGAWTANWENVSHGMELRWPYVFVASYEDGLQILNMRDPSRPRAVGFYHTFDGPHNRGWGGVDTPMDGNNVFNGAFGVDVRNADGLVVVSDMQSGFWAFKLDGFNGWNGTTWGMPNVSSVQDWESGPPGVIRKPVL